MIGTNNHGDSAADIAEGIAAICDLIKEKQPQAYLVVLVSDIGVAKSCTLLYITYKLINYIHTTVSPLSSPCFPVATARTHCVSATPRSTGWWASDCAASRGRSC